MAQAEHLLTTRRGFSKWLAAVGAVALVPVSAKAEPVSADLIHGAEAVKKKWDVYIEARCAVDDCEQLMEDWEELNPMPDSSDDKYTMSEYWVVLGNDKAAWHDRRMVALRKSGVAKAKLKTNNAKDELIKAIHGFSLIKCAGVTDLLFKTKASIDLDDESSLIANAIIYDLLQFHNIEIPD